MVKMVNYPGSMPVLGLESESGLASVLGLALELVYWSEHTNQPPETSKGSSYEYE
ncbi:hypothetical protein LINGRAHAP2_LOCUS32900 [Linum grandiflorum]